jgi:hypothetical protein
MGRQGDEVCPSEVLCVCFVGRDRPEEKTAQSRGSLGAWLLFRDDRIFVVDQRISVGARRVDERQALVGWGARPKRRRRGLDRLRRGLTPT